MIGRLKGIVDDIGDGWAIIDVNGVGYTVEGSNRMLSHLPMKGEAVTLAIETYVREDQIRLFGFLTEKDRHWFRLLLGVQGVGAKVALAIQTVLSSSELTQAIASQDKDMLARALGVGKKSAQRIVHELKDKIPEADFLVHKIGTKREDSAIIQDSVSALTNLGYARLQAREAVMAVVKQSEKEMVTADILRLALRELAG